MLWRVSVLRRDDTTTSTLRSTSRYLTPLPTSSHILQPTSTTITSTIITITHINAIIMHIFQPPLALWTLGCYHGHHFHDWCPDHTQLSQLSCITHYAATSTLLIAHPAGMISSIQLFHSAATYRVLKAIADILRSLQTAEVDSTVLIACSYHLAFL